MTERTTPAEPGGIPGHHQPLNRRSTTVRLSTILTEGLVYATALVLFLLWAL